MLGANKKRAINIKEQINFHGQLNIIGSIFLASNEKGKFIVKKISMGQEYPKLKQMQETVMKKLYGSSQPLILKPDFYDI